jgi:enoyl-CoA hydratase/carnithine racemase
LSSIHSVANLRYQLATYGIKLERDGSTASFERGPSKVLTAIKRSINPSIDLPLEYVFTIERSIFAEAFDSQDKTIGMTNFLDKKQGRAVFIGQ